jgi:hypothetical protein
LEELYSLHLGLFFLPNRKSFLSLLNYLDTQMIDVIKRWKCLLLLQELAYAMTVPSSPISGFFRAKNTKISKRNTPYLRKALFQAASAAVRKRSNGICNSVLYEYYTNKVNTGKPPKVTLVTTGSNLLWIIFRILSSHTKFRIE